MINFFFSRCRHPIPEKYFCQGSNWVNPYSCVVQYYQFTNNYFYSATKTIKQRLEISVLYQKRMRVGASYIDQRAWLWLARPVVQVTTLLVPHLPSRYSIDIVFSPNLITVPGTGGPGPGLSRGRREKRENTHFIFTNILNSELFFMTLLWLHICTYFQPFIALRCIVLVSVFSVRPLTLESLDTANVHEPGWFQLKMQIYGLSN